jgi:hypothetical protein
MQNAECRIELTRNPLVSFFILHSSFFILHSSFFIHFIARRRWAITPPGG